MRCGKHHHYWLAAGDCNGDDWLQVEMDSARYVHHLELEPSYRPDSHLTHFRILVDGKDITPEDFDATLAAYNSGTTWAGWQAAGATCDGPLLVNVKSVARSIKLVDLTSVSHCGFGEVRVIGKELPRYHTSVLPSGALPSAGGGSAGQTSYTSPSGWTVSSNQPTYRNGNLYWMSNVMDGSEACKPSTCSERVTRCGKHHHYWLAAGDCNGDDWLQVEMDSARYVHHLELEPSYRPDSHLTHFRILVDGKDITPEDFDATLAAYNSGTTWARWQAAGATCDGPLLVNAKSVARSIKLVDLTSVKHCGFGEVRVIGKELPRYH